MSRIVTYNQVESIKGSLVKVGTKPDVLFYAFHTRLSMFTPTMRLVITGDLREHGEVLYQLLLSAVDNALDRPLLVATVWAFNQWLMGYSEARVKDEVVMDSLMWALGRVLGIEMLPTVLIAWCDLICRMREIDQELGDLFHVEEARMDCEKPTLHVSFN